MAEQMKMGKFDDFSTEKKSLSDLQNNIVSPMEGSNPKTKEALNLWGYPSSVVTRIEKDYENDPKGLLEARKKLLAITFTEGSKETGNTIEVANKTFTILKPEADGEDVREWSGEYAHVRYIRGNAIEKYLNDKKLFLWNELGDFIDTYIPGSTREVRTKNFCWSDVIRRGWFIWFKWSS